MEGSGCRLIQGFSRNFRGGTEKYHENFSQNSPFSGLPEYDAGMLTTRQRPSVAINGQVNPIRAAHCNKGLKNTKVHMEGVPDPVRCYR
jgi:hypothetical protein